MTLRLAPRLRSSGPWLSWGSDAVWGAPGTQVSGVFGRGRDALWHVARDRVAPLCARIWLPAYACPDMLRAFERCGVKLEFFDLRDDLAPDWGALLARAAQIDEPQALLFADYFGYPTTIDASIVDHITTQFSFVVRDSAHALPTVWPLLVEGAIGGVVVHSLRKLLPVPDGALVVEKSTNRMSGSLPAPAYGVGTTLLNSAYLAVEIVARAVPLLRDTMAYRHVYREWREDRRIVGASRLTRALLPRFDQAEIARIRHRNAQLLTERLLPWAVFPRVPHGASPYQFPIAVARRDEVRAALGWADIEAEAPWPLPHIGDSSDLPTSRRLSERVLTLPVHQDLDIPDIERLSDTVRRTIE